MHRTAPFERFAILRITCYIITCISVIGAMTMNRPQDTRFYFTHFTSFEDMTHARSRAQRMGIQTFTAFEDRKKIPIWPGVTADITGILKTYLDTAKSVKKGNECKITLLEMLNTVLSGDVEQDTFFLGCLMKGGANDPSCGGGYDFYTSFFDQFVNEKILMPRPADDQEPLFMYGLKAWKIFYLLAVSSNLDLYEIRPPDERLANFTSPRKIYDEWSLVFIDEYCNTVREHFKDKVQFPSGFCPDPCMTQPCVGISYTSSARCTATGTFSYHFTCRCQPNFKWVQPNNAFGHCQSDDNCTAYCDPVGTRRCDIIEFKQFCVCRPSHMGPTCNKLRDPCLELSSPMEMPGNTYCNVAKGGKCVGDLGTNNFKCICPNAYSSDPTYSLPNCMGFKDRCLSTLCIQGDCISSKDGQEAYCVCPDEVYGDHCELTRGKWAQWSPWSECTPNCGISEYQRRYRTRDCLGEACRGGEGHLQMEMCDILPCPDETLALARQGRTEEVNELKVQLLQAQAARYVKLVGAVAKAFVIISCIFAAVSATAMAVSVHFL